MMRVMAVRRTCDRCDDGIADSGSTKDFVERTVCLPTGFIADATSFALKHRASKAWEVKPSCADLQLVNLACAARDNFRRLAYLTVGCYAVDDELSFMSPTRSNSRLWRYIFCARRQVCCPTAWEPYDIPAGEPRKPRTEQAIEIAPGGTGEDDEVEPDRLQDFCGPREDNVNPDEPAAEAALKEAEAATVVEQQQRAYVENGVLRSTTTTTQSDRPEMMEPPGLEGGNASGNRTAVPRFPQVTAKTNFLHSNNAINLEQAHQKRNIGIGNHNPFVSEAKTRDLLVDGLIDEVFNISNAKKAMKEFESIRTTALPKKLTHDGQMRVELEAMNAELKRDIVGFDTVIKAFCKSEVSGKDKPRGIANHGEKRLYALAKVAFCFEHIMFDVFQAGSIKGRPKHKAMEQIYTNMSKMRKGARWVENDLTAFEFGISEPLKQIEQRIFLHIAKLIGVEDVGVELFERVVDDRDKSATWRMTYKDATGEKKTVKVRIPQTMRESGDRVTSSGNFLQNLIAWFSFLVDSEHVISALKALIKFKGAKMFYVSPRDTNLVQAPNKVGLVRRRYLACFAFEGDDTVGRFEEDIWTIKDCKVSKEFLGLLDCPVGAFFTRWGWKAKLVWKPLEGDSYVRFVGCEALISDGEVVHDGGELVMTPEVKRFLTTKSWTTTDVTPQELKTCIQIYAATLAEGFKHVEPIHAFLKAIYDSNEGGITVKAEKVREYILAKTGELPSAGATATSMPFPGFEGGDSDKWKRLLRHSAGDFNDREWAEMSHVGSVDVHGADLAICVPATWRD